MVSYLIMMTTSSAFGINNRITDPLQGEQTEHAPVQVSNVQRKEERPAFSEDQKKDILRKAVEKYIAGAISQDELSTIYKITE